MVKAVESTLKFGQASHPSHGVAMVRGESGVLANGGSAHFRCEAHQLFVDEVYRAGGLDHHVASSINEKRTTRYPVHKQDAFVPSMA